MPLMISSAWDDPAKYTGDLRTHEMAIDPTQMQPSRGSTLPAIP